MSARAFDLGDVLSISDGRLVSPRRMGGIYDILNFMTGDNLTTIGLCSAFKPCRAALLEQHPQLVGVGPDDVHPDSIPSWLCAQKERLGETLDVRPLASWERRTLDSDVADVLAINPNARILTVDPERGEVA